jgi:CheY-like chemotaxis protein
LPDKDILIVDDEAEVRKLFADVLRDRGYSVDLAATMAEAITLLSDLPVWCGAGRLAFT